MIIGVTGATGQLGRATIAALKSRGRGHEVIGLARAPERATDLGVAVRRFDYDAPEGLAAMLEGVDRLLLISANAIGRRGLQHRAVIAAAKRAGVGLIAYTSLLHADVSPIGLAAEHRETEADLRASGLRWAILRNSWYSENFMAALPQALASGAYLGATGGALLTAAPRADYAEAAAAALLAQDQPNRIHELSGDQPFTLFDLCAEISRQSGRAIRYDDRTPEDYARALTENGAPKDRADFLAGLDAALARGALDDASHDLSRLIGRPTTPLSAVVATALAQRAAPDQSA